jgi:hypothetical protein
MDPDHKKSVVSFHPTPFCKSTATATATSRTDRIFPPPPAASPPPPLPGPPLSTLHSPHLSTHLPNIPAEERRSARCSGGASSVWPSRRQGVQWIESGERQSRRSFDGRGRGGGGMRSSRLRGGVERLAWTAWTLTVSEQGRRVGLCVCVWGVCVVLQDLELGGVVV